MRDWKLEVERGEAVLFTSWCGWCRRTTKSRGHDAWLDGGVHGCGDDVERRLRWRWGREKEGAPTGVRRDITARRQRNGSRGGVVRGECITSKGVFLGGRGRWGASTDVH
jgi:hypothetical protein